MNERYIPYLKEYQDNQKGREVYQNMYEDLKKTYPELEVGKILWCSDSMHLYSRHYGILKSFVDSEISCEEPEFDL